MKDEQNVTRLKSLSADLLPDPRNEQTVRFCPQCGVKIAKDQTLCDYCRKTPPLKRKRKNYSNALLLFILALLIIFWMGSIYFRQVFSTPSVPTPIPTFYYEEE